MPRPHRGGFESWLRGGQTVGHTFDMTVEVIGKMVLLIITPITLIVLWVTAHAMTPAQQLAGMETVEAHVLASIGHPLTQTLSIKADDGTTHIDDVHAVARDPYVASQLAGFNHAAFYGSVLEFVLLVAVGIVANLIFQISGQEKIKARQIRGQIVVPLSDLIRQILEFNVEEVRRRAEEARLAALPPQLQKLRLLAGRATATARGEVRYRYRIFEDLNPFRRRPRPTPTPDQVFQPPLIGGVPYPYKTELEHTVIVGAPGSGKSVAFHGLIDSIRAKGERAIIFDPELDYIRTHYDPATDIILNPFDARSPGWSPFYDARDTPDWVKLGHAIFKDPRSGDPYWVNVARSLFSWTGYQLMEQRRRLNEKATAEERRDVILTEALDYLFGPVQRLKTLLEGTPAAMHLGGLEGARVSSLISVLAEGVEPLIYLHGSKERFSIREWVNRPAAEDAPKGGFLFFSAPESHMDALRPLLSFWSDLAVSTLLSRHDGISRDTTWFLLDEFHAAGRVDTLADGPQRLRKYGGAVVLGFQQYSQLTDLYGPDKARTILGNCQTKLILRAGDFETATLMSEQLGRRVMRRVDENTSYGANSIRDGVGLIPKEDLEPIVLPEDVQNFAKLEGMLRVSSARPGEAFPIAPIRLAYVDRPERAPGFIPSDGDPVREYLNRAMNGGAPGPASGLNGDGGPQAPKPQGPAPRGPRPGGRGPVTSSSGNTPSRPDQTADVAPSKTATSPPAGQPDEPARPIRNARLMASAVRTYEDPRQRSASARDDDGATAPAVGAGYATSAAQSDEEPVLDVEDVDGGPSDETWTDTDKVLVARPEDLPDSIEARRARRKKEEIDEEWARRQAINKEPPENGRLRQSVMQKEGDVLKERAVGEELGALEHATKGEIIYAEHHQHDVFGQAADLLIAGVVGANMIGEAPEEDLAEISVPAAAHSELNGPGLVIANDDSPTLTGALTVGGNRHDNMDGEAAPVDELGADLQPSCQDPPDAERHQGHSHHIHPLLDPDRPLWDQPQLDMSHNREMQIGDDR